MNGPAVVAWVAIGYILFAGLLLAIEPQVILIALAFALMPVVQRPRGSLALGIAVAAISAFAWRVAIAILLRSSA